MSAMMAEAISIGMEMEALRNSCRIICGSTELHIYPRGDHGLGLAPNDPHVAQWSQALLRWLQYCEANKEQSL